MDIVQNRVVDAPVARDTDPLTSFQAGENPSARQASELEVLLLLTDAGRPLSDAEVVDFHRATRGIDGDWFTEQRLRTARKQLVDKGLVRDAGVREGASPTGRRAHVWEIAA